jgi:hypothetical protein
MAKHESNVVNLKRQARSNANIHMGDAAKHGAAADAAAARGASHTAKAADLNKRAGRAEKMVQGADMTAAVGAVTSGVGLAAYATAVIPPRQQQQQPQG